MSGAPGTATAIVGSPTEFVRARAGTLLHRVRADLAGGAQDITRHLACAPRLIAGGGVPSVTISETSGVMSGAMIEGTAVGRTSAAIGTNGVASAVSGATVAQGVTSGMIVVRSVVACAATIAGKITSVKSAVIPAMTLAASAGAVASAGVRSAVNVPKFPVEMMLARSAGPIMPVRTAATARPEKRAAIVNLVRPAAEEGATAATAAIVDLYLCPAWCDGSLFERHGLCAIPGGAPLSARLPKLSVAREPTPTDLPASRVADQRIDEVMIERSFTAAATVAQLTSGQTLQ